MCGAGALRDCSTHILVSATCLVVLILILTCIRVSWVHIFVNIASCRRGRAVVVLCWIVGGVVRRVRGVVSTVVYRRCWGRGEIIGLGKVTGIIRVCGRLTWAVTVRTVAALTICGFIFV